MIGTYNNEYIIYFHICNINTMKKKQLNIPYALSSKLCKNIHIYNGNVLNLP